MMAPSFDGCLSAPQVRDKKLAGCHRLAAPPVHPERIRHSALHCADVHTKNKEVQGATQSAHAPPTTFP